MKLIRLEAENFRSLRDISGTNAIEFEGLDGLVGKNNVGKTNTISAVRFLLGEERKSNDEELYWKRKKEECVEVKGFFEIAEGDLCQIKSKEKRKEVEDCIFQSGKYEGTIGICRRTIEDDYWNTEFKIIRDLPSEDRLQREKFLEYRDECWAKQKDTGDYTKTNYRDDLQESYSEIVTYMKPGKSKNKGSWETAYDKFVSEKPEDVDFEPQTYPIQGLKQTLFDQVLPRVIDIPAKKQVDDATRTASSAEFGGLIQELSDEIKEEIDQQIQDKLQEVHQQLNPTSEGERLDSVKRLEERISKYLSETFSDHSVSLQFPKLKSSQMFRDTNVLIEEQDLDEPVSTENIGQGVNRALIFSLVRTLADMRGGALSIADEDVEASEQDNRPLLILYEEAELFLHPGLQKILLGAFSKLFEGGNQVVFSTHSPNLVNYNVLESIHIVSKSNCDGTRTTPFHSVLADRSESRRFQLTQLQQVSKYIFADKVILVEGISEQIVLQKMARVVNPSWNLEHNEIPVLPVHGKHNMPLFKSFLEALGIDVFVIIDVDAVRETVTNLSQSEEVKELQKKLREEAQRLVDSDEAPNRKAKKEVEDVRSKDSWRERIEDLHEMELYILNGDSPTDQHRRALRDLLEKVMDSDWKKAITSDKDTVKAIRVSLSELLLKKRILLLNGEIEDYYGGSRNKKRESAINFSVDETSRGEIVKLFTELPDSEEYDMVRFFEMVFESGS